MSFESKAARHLADLRLALTLADSADIISTSRFLAADLLVETKPDLTPVSEADKAIEESLIAQLRKLRPADAVAGEEFGGLANGVLPAGRTWVIDPIDGTKNYVRGVPIWATLIGLLDEGEPVVGVVSAPALGRRWWAAIGAGAFTAVTIAGFDPRARQLHVSKIARLADSSFSYSDPVGWSEKAGAGSFENLASSVWRSRAYGDFYSHLLVAEGAVDLAAEPELNAWDLAALIPIVREAGGKLTGFDGSNPLLANNAMTSNGLIHAEALAKLA